MTERRASATSDPSAWHGLREYLAAAYSNAEMRTLIERSLLARGATLLPDERVSPLEYATTLCGLIQRHSGLPTPEMWHQMLHDRPLRQREVAKLRALFMAEARERADAPPRRVSPEHGGWWARPRLVVGFLVSLAVAVGTYCASVPTRQTILCRDGTRSPTCYERSSGCCSGHGGFPVEDKPAVP